MTLRNTLTLSIFLHSCAIGSVLILGASPFLHKEEASSLQVLMVSLPGRSTLDANKNITAYNREIVSEKKEATLDPLFYKNTKTPDRIRTKVGDHKKSLQDPPTVTMGNDPNVLKKGAEKEATAVMETPLDEIIEALSQTVSMEANGASKESLPHDSVLLSSLFGKEGKETDVHIPRAAMDVCASTECPSLMDDFIQEVRTKLQRTKRYPWLARLKGLEGTVQVGFRIGPSGSVGGVHVALKSDYKILDRAALSIVKKAARFPPTPTGSEVELVIPMQFRLDAK